MKPNILFVFSDRHRRADLGCYGNRDIFTPHFNRFAETASVFTNCVSNSPVRRRQRDYHTAA